MTDVGTVVERAPDGATVRITVLPPSCGRCETAGGHCDHELRELAVRVPPEYRGTVQVGYRVRIGASAGALLRALRRLVVVPALVAAAAALLSTPMVRTAADETLWRGLIAAGAAVLTMVMAALRGGGQEDLPVVRDLLDGEAPVLTPVTPVSPGSTQRPGIPGTMPSQR